LHLCDALENGESKEQILLCKSLRLAIERRDTFRLSNSYVIAKGFSWKQCVDICTGGGIADGGRNAQFIGARVTAFGPEGIGNAARRACVATKIQTQWKRCYGKLVRF